MILDLLLMEEILHQLILVGSWHTACRRPCAKLPILGFGGWGGVGWGMMLTVLELTHMVDATQHDGVEWGGE